MEFKRPFAPEEESYNNAEGVLVTTLADSRYRVKHKEFFVAEVAWKDARDWYNWKYSKDTVSVTMAIAAPFGP